MSGTNREGHAQDGDLPRALAELGADPPRPLVDRIVSRWVRLPGPIGEVFVSFTDQGIQYLRVAAAVADAESFCAELRSHFGQPTMHATRPPRRLITALRTGSPGGLRFDLRLLTEFERAVLRSVGRIPRGEVRPYSWVANEIGRAHAVRAVGTALRRNPVPLLIPCHRVTTANGNIGQYVFGMATKEALLRAEGVDVGELRDLAASRVRYLGSATTRIVCFPTCHHARRITTPHRRWFSSIQDAAQLGYRPCRDCRPVAASPPGDRL